MNRQQLAQVIASMNLEQLEALRVCIVAERRLRVIYPRTAVSEPALTEAYDWACNASSGALAEVELP